MPSSSLQAFLGALAEVEELGMAARPTLAATGAQTLNLARAVGRGQVVLLSAHFERYVYALNEEIITYLNSCSVSGEKVPKVLKLQHSINPIDDLSRTSWENRSNQLAAFVAQDGWLWATSANGKISHDRLLAWMKAPNPKNLKRYFQFWGMEDVFGAITRTKSTRSSLWLGIQGLVDLRNNIAHGDFQAQATQSDVKRYVKHAKKFCGRVDRQVSARISNLFSVPRPW